MLTTLQAREKLEMKQTLTLNFKEIPLSRFIDEVEKSSDYRFIFKLDDVDLDHSFDLKVVEQPIETILDLALSNTGLAYKVLDYRIYLTVKDTVSPSNTGIAPIGNPVTVSGTVTDENGQALFGAIVVEKGTTNGVTTNYEGEFTLNVSSPEVTLAISYIGFLSQEIPLNGRKTLRVSLQEEVAGLDEVVVTAFGLKQDKKALGYTSQDLDPKELSQSRETNFVNGLSGKVAGVNITNSPSGIGGSSLITIRGTSSLDLSKNSPLFVVDGTPVSNGFFSPRGDGTRDVDYGNDAGEINPQNIASINVLKGPAAAALYGSRAANGAIIITTKKGDTDGLLKVSLNSSVGVETLLTMPEWQNEYGQGNNQEFTFVDGSGSGTNDGLDESWGPRLDAGLMVPQFDSPRTDGTRGGDVDVSNADIVPTPWISHPDNVRDFFQTGLVLNNGIAVSKGGKFGSFRLAYQNLDQKGIVPYTDLKRNNINLSASLDLAKGLKLNTRINYLKQDSDNRPSVSYGTENIMYLWVWYGRQINTASLKNYWQEGLEGSQQFNYNYNYHDNAYFNVYENTNTQDKDRLYGNINLSYDFLDHFTVMLRTGRDFYRDLRTKRRAFSTQRFPRGYYREDDIFYEEINTDFLVSYQNSFNGIWKVDLSVGGNRLDQQRTYNRTMADELINPGVYSFNNARSQLKVVESDQDRRVNSLYGFGRFSYDEKLFLELSARNDWSSTLPSNNNSYFYPSANLSMLLDRYLKLPEAISFAQIRTAFAAVGNDTDPYRNGQPVYNNGGTYAGYPILSESSTITNANLKPENTSSFEIGADIRFFDDALGLDIAVYKNITTNQILNVPSDIASGYSNRAINLGKVENRGVELILNARPIYKQHFKWNVTANYSSNRSKVSDLSGIDYTIVENKAFIQAREGGSISAMYGRGFQRVDDHSSPYHGQIIYDSSGAPLRTDGLEYQGDYAPDFMLGIQNQFRINNFDIGFLFDIRKGGMIVSRTKVVGSLAGQLKETLVGREEGLIGEGVVETSPGVYAPNETKVSARTYYHNYYKSDNVEASKYDASYIKLREVGIGYTLPSSISEKFSLDNVRVSLTGRNLALWTENPHFDPETLSVEGGTLNPGYEYMSLPSTRSFTVNININF
ncbi:SusC/RagA family TonB-linked outer membrane protein [Echinicola soli]|nr:SusC/RagA family TonB-linked outer membrane protein [Echinicola soli]